MRLLLISRGDVKVNNYRSVCIVSIVFIIDCIFTASFGSSASVQLAAGISATSIQPLSNETRFVESTNFTFSMKGRLAAGRAAAQFVQLLNYFGLNYQITNWLQKNESNIRDVLQKSAMPGALVYVEMQKSNSDVSVQNLVGDAPYLVGPGLTQVDAWRAFALSDNKDLHPRVSAGYRSNQQASFFLWVEPDGSRLKYGFTFLATLILNEARRVVSDERLEAAFRDDYDHRLASYLSKGSQMTPVSTTTFGQRREGCSHKENKP
jgi:hypothetical protein